MRLTREGLVALVFSAVLLAACGDSSEQDQCSQYDDVVSSVDDLQALDLTTVKAEEVQAQVEVVEDELDQLQDVSDGRVETAIRTFRAAVDVVLRVALDSTGSEGLEAAHAQLQKAQEALAQNWALLQERMNTVCETG